MTSWGWGGAVGGGGGCWWGLEFWYQQLPNKTQRPKSKTILQTKLRAKPLLRAVFKGRREDLMGIGLCEHVHLSLDPNSLLKAGILCCGVRIQAVQRRCLVSASKWLLSHPEALSPKGGCNSAWQGSLGISLYLTGHCHIFSLSLTVEGSHTFSVAYDLLKDGGGWDWRSLLWPLKLCSITNTCGVRRDNQVKGQKAPPCFKVKEQRHSTTHGRMSVSHSRRGRGQGPS